jgi:hypothetical protein
MISYKVHSRWIFLAKLLSRCKSAPPFLVIFTLSCFIRDRAIESSRPQSPNIYPSDVEPSKSLRHPTRYGCSALGWCPTKHPCRSPHQMKERPSTEGGRAATRPRSHVMKKPRRFPRRQSHVGPFLCILVFHCNVENLPHGRHP